MRWRSAVLGLALVAGATGIRAEPPPRAERPARAPAVQDRGFQAGPTVYGHGERVVGELGLDAEQAARVRAIVAGERARARDLLKQLRIPPELRERNQRIQQELREAQAAGDVERAAALRREHREQFEKTLRERRAVIMQELGPIQRGETLRTKIREVLRDDQLAAFDAYWDREVGKPPPPRSAEILRSELSRLDDLDAEQEQRIEAAFAAYEAAGRKPPERFGYVKRLKQLYDDVYAVLNETQRARLER